MPRKSKKLHFSHFSKTQQHCWHWKKVSHGRLNLFFHFLFFSRNHKNKYCIYEILCPTDSISIEMINVQIGKLHLFLLYLDRININKLRFFVSHFNPSDSFELEWDLESSFLKFEIMTSISLLGFWKSCELALFVARSLHSPSHYDNVLNASARSICQWGHLFLGKKRLFWTDFGHLIF